MEPRGGAAEEGVGGILVGKVIVLSRNMYLTNRTTDSERVTICETQENKLSIFLEIQ